MVNLGKLKQVWEMRKAAKTMQSALGEVAVVGESLHGQIKVHLDGNQKITQVNIDPALLTPDQKENVENGFIEAHKKALNQLQEIMTAKVKSGELKIPDLKL